MQKSHADKPASQSPSGSSPSEGRNLNIHALRHHYLLQMQGGRLYPERIPLNAMERVLDIGCATGEWVFDMAKRHPHLHLFGIDGNEAALHIARVRRNLSNLQRVEFRQMDITQPLAITDRLFDFVHMRNGGQSIQPGQWPAVIQECIRVLKPKGWLVLAEIEFGEISSPAFMRLHYLTAQAMVKLGKSFDRSGISTGPAAHLYSMLLQTELEEVSYEPFIIDLGFVGGNTARQFVSSIVQQAVLFEQPLVQLDLIDKRTFDILIEEIQNECTAPDICGWAFLISVSGRRTA